jgi:hypothetical protein
MKSIDLTNSELFQSLLEIQFENEFIDFHNTCTCEKISYKNQTNDLAFQFKNGNEGTKFPLIEIIFKNATLHSLEFSVESVITNLTIDNFYRGRFQNGDILEELSNDGRRYFYIEFYEGFFIELLCEKVTILFP